VERKVASEFIGTFCLVFAGTGAIVINDLTAGMVTHVGIAMTFGLIVLAMIYALGDTSGAHLNPAVTFGFFAAGRLESRMVFPYMLSQTAGAVTASGVLKILFPQHPTLGEHASRGLRRTIACSGTYPHCDIDVRDSLRINGGEGEGNYRGHRDRISGRVGRVICGPDQRRFHRKMRWKQQAQKNVGKKVPKNSDVNLLIVDVAWPPIAEVLKPTIHCLIA
jgi:hypothetical protein